MKRILLRAPKDPFEVFSAQETLERNLIAGNAGNLIFIEAAYKILATRDSRVEVDRLRVRPDEADRINERYDVYVIPLANAFRFSFEPHLVRMTRLIERLRIPVVVLGVGAQSDVHYSMERLKPLERTVRAFVAAVLDRSPSIGVRGEFSHAYLAHLGFRDLEVIGCPSMFMFGDSLRIEKRSAALGREARVAVNVTPHRKAMGPILMAHYGRYPNLEYVAQDLDTLALLLYGEPLPGGYPGHSMPTHPWHPLFRENKARFFIDPWPWISYLRDVDFAFGTRIHGNIAALIAGTPAYVLAHDSRTLELARYFGIPHRRITEVQPGMDAAELYEEADFRELVSGHAARFGVFLNFLGRHGLAHVFADGEDPSAFDVRAERTPYPAPIDAAQALGSRGPGVYLGRLRRRILRLRQRPWVRRLRTELGRSA